MNSRFQNALKRQPQNIPPVWLMRQAGRYHQHYQKLRAQHSFVELCKNPELAAETAMGPIRDFDFDAAILFSDLLFPLEALGMGLTYDPAPRLGFQLNEQTFSKLKPWSDACPALAFQGDAVAATRAVLPSDKSLVGFVGGPWTLFVYAVEGSHKGSLIESKKLIQTLFPRFAEVMLPLLAYTIGRQLANGAETVMIFDTAAGELSPDYFGRFVKPFLVALAKLYPGKLGYYGKNLTDAHVGMMQHSGAPLAGLGVDHRHALAKMLPLHELGFLQGNFDQSLLHLDEKAFETAARNYLALFQEVSVKGRAGWVAGLGHGVLPGTPERNVKRWVELVRETFA
ncbi:MAG: uroporphyrinogen decarboxylase family protein [Bdellovibrionota bacterium]